MFKGGGGKLLSKGGKEVLINVVAQVIPTYIMSVFQLPMGISVSVRRLISSWLGFGGKNRVKMVLTLLENCHHTTHIIQ